jgi:PAS domain S-box-containing protein
MPPADVKPQSDPSARRSPFVLTRYTKLIPAHSPLVLGVAMGTVAVATVLRLALGPVLGEATPFITMFPAVLLTSVMGGFWPGLLAIALSVISSWYFFLSPAFGFDGISASDAIALALYVIGALLMVLVATSMRRALDRLETAQEKLFAALDASGTGTWRWDIQRDLIEWDPAMTKVFGLGVALPPRRLDDLLELVHPEDRRSASLAVSDAVRKGIPAEYEFRPLPSDGPERWIHNRSRVSYDGEGRPLYMIGACLDITERKRAEQRQTLLLHELNHRVKNTLATMQSLAMQTLRSSPGPEAFQTNFMARLMALSATHDVLTQRLWESATLDEILGAELKPHGGIDQQRIKAGGASVQLKPQQALSLGMALHELATNAAKYGALSSPQGSVEISWSVSQGEGGERQLEIRWRERDGPEVRAPERKGFGTRLIERSIVHELGGAIETNYAPTGVECQFRVPLNP